MKIAEFAVKFLINFAIVFICSLIVAFLYNYFFHGTIDPEWFTAIRFGIILGLVFTIMNRKK